MRWFRLFIALGIVLLALATGACESMQDFVGIWQGPISPDPQLQQGFGKDAQLSLTISGIDSGDLQMLALMPGQERPFRFEAIRRASADALGALSLPGDSLRSYLGYLGPPGQEPYLIVVTLYSQSRIEARVIRGPDETYGVFALKKR